MEGASLAVDRSNNIRRVGVIRPIALVEGVSTTTEGVLGEINDVAVWVVCFTAVGGALYSCEGTRRKTGVTIVNEDCCL